MKKERLNDLDGRTWLKYSSSIWRITKSQEEMKLKHPAMFPVALCERLIEIYTKIGDRVLDPFMGSGSTLVAAKKLGRKGIGIDIVDDYVNLARERVSREKTRIPLRNIRLTTFMEPEERQQASRPSLEGLDTEPQVFCEDARNLLDFVKPNSVDFVITSPPYWMIHRRRRTADYKKIRPYSGLEKDLGNIPDYGEFLSELKEIFGKVRVVLKPNKRCVIIVMDIRVESDFIPFHIDIINMMKDLKFTFEDTIIWDRSAEYNNIRPLGYPYVFVVNKMHENILIFKKTD